MRGLFDDARTIVLDSTGEASMNDAFIALACRDLGIRFLASFDRDFDRLPWLTWLAAPADVSALASE